VAYVCLGGQISSKDLGRVDTTHALDMVWMIRPPSMAKLRTWKLVSVAYVRVVALIYLVDHCC
jgi:hypothetical protein